MLAFSVCRSAPLARYKGSGAGPELHRNVDGEVLSEEHGYFSRGRLEEAFLLDDQVVFSGLQQRKSLAAVGVEVVTKFSPVEELVRVKVTSGTIPPVGSVMVPLNPPVTIVCAEAVQVRNKHSRIAIPVLPKNIFVMIKDPPL